MSFGRPANFNPFSKPLPPERGSFPLDHFGIPFLLLFLLKHPLMGTLWFRRMQGLDEQVYEMYER